MMEPGEKIKHDPESMCLPNSLEFAVRKLLGEKANTVDFEKYRVIRAKQLEDESKYNSPLNIAKRENQSGRVVRLVAQDTDEFVKLVLGEINQQTNEHLVSHTQYISGDDLVELDKLSSHPGTVCLLSTRDHIEPVTNNDLNRSELKRRIDDSFELAPYGNITIISKT